MLGPDLINVVRVGCGLELASKKRLIETLAGLLARDHPRLQAETVFEHLLERERLGSTGLGHGVALPHSRMKDVTTAIGAFVQTVQGVDYDASDGEAVDLAFALLVPEEANDEHLRLLAHLASLFNDPSRRVRLREATSADEILQILTAH
ncbi:PTS system, nitrogen regulatory IIA component [Allochromatium warmingii]|uniref:PTS system, nitrogen regulatory IIA component n=1 Tax=Allochromatium warmingii TaxID=61595 RepID=A0A1H3ASK6_ALLWA|nr:PTS sugar transporter subunit IIA [Allochromatium warmingii]SDX32381.1 PTS system, nitrogen regulatory IIA component [Allochromatium warmingii]